jgi:hypothetical protein
MSDEFSKMTDAQLRSYIASHKAKSSSLGKVSGKKSSSSIGKALKAAPNAIGGHFTNEALFGMPKAIPAVRENLEQSEREHPILSGIGKGLGLVAGIGTGGGVLKAAGTAGKLASKAIPAVRALSKGKTGAKLAKIAAKPLARSMGQGAAYGALNNLGEGIGARDVRGKDILEGATKGAMLGGAVHGAGSAVRAMAPKARKATQAAKSLNMIEGPERARAKGLKLGDTLIDRGSPRTLGTANALRHLDDNVQGMFEKRMRGMTEGNKKQAYDLVDKHFGKGNIGKFNAGMDRLSATKAKPYYEKAFKNDAKNIPLEVHGDKHYQTTRDKIYKGRNQITDISKNPDNFEYQDRIKRSLHSQEQVARRSGDDYLANEIGGTRHKLTESLKAQSPDYAKALEKSGKYIRAKEAAEKGQQAFDPSTRVGDIAEHRAGSRYGHKMGVKDALMKKIESYPSEEGNIAAKLNAPHMSEKLEKVLGKGRHGRFSKEVDDLGTKHRNFHSLTRGSQTSKNAADVANNPIEKMSRNVARAALRPKRAAINAAAKTVGKLNVTGKPDLTAKLMLHPQHIGRVEKILSKDGSNTRTASKLKKAGRFLKKNKSKMAGRMGVVRRYNEEDYD